MDSLISSLPQLTAYQPALTALAVLCLAVLIQNFLTAPLAYIKNEQTPGLPLRGDHTLLSVRAVRTYENSAESLPAFGLVLLLAILIGVNTTLVNWLAIIHVGFRLAFWAVYYSGIGKVAGGPRTFCFVGGLVANIVLAIAAIYFVL